MAKIQKIIYTCNGCEYRMTKSIKYLSERSVLGTYGCNYSNCQEFQHTVIQSVDGVFIRIPIPDWCPLEDYKED
jgi:hypothetical protein